MRIVMYLPMYNEKVGGIIALHKLMNLLRCSGLVEKVYAFPYFDTAFYDVKGVVQNNPSDFEKYKFTISNLHHFKINAEFVYEFIDIANISNLHHLIMAEDLVVIYPEVISGNPVGVKKVARWLLHDPGRLTGKVYYETGEIYFPYTHFTADLKIPHSKTSSSVILIQHTPFEVFNTNGVAAKRAGSAYCLRKGKDRKIIHDLQDSICIDDLTQDEVAKVFKKVEYFYAYDTRTFYSQLAALCGCKSIIIPHPHLDVHDDPSFLLGVAYGMKDLERAEQTKPLLLQQLKKEEESSRENAIKMLKEICDFFDLDITNV